MTTVPAKAGTNWGTPEQRGEGKGVVLAPCVSAGLSPALPCLPLSDTGPPICGRAIYHPGPEGGNTEPQARSCHSSSHQPSEDRLDECCQKPVTRSSSILGTGCVLHAGNLDQKVPWTVLLEDHRLFLLPSAEQPSVWPGQRRLACQLLPACPTC